MYANANQARQRIALIATPVILAVAVSIAGCSASPGITPTPGGSDGSSPSSAPGQSSDDHAHRDGEEDDHPSVPVPEANTASQTDAVAAATAAVTAFARPSLPEQQWWTELLPSLSQTGAVAYEGTLPSNIPVTTVTGAAVVLDASTDVATLVEVPTDAGAYLVTRVRGSTDEPWLAERIRPAGQ